MIIFMAGFPFSGKSYVVDMVTDRLDKKIRVISPKTFLLGEARTEADRQLEMVSAWEVSLEDLDKHMKNINEIIIYDTACSSLVMETYFKKAKDLKHKIIYVFVQASLDTCAKRAGDSWLPEQVISKYTNNFEKSIKLFKSIADVTIVIKNDTDSPPDIVRMVNIIDGK